MEFIYYPSKEAVEAVYGTDEILMMLVAFDGSKAVLGLNDEAYEHHIMLAQVGIRETEIDKYFRIVFDNTAADWTFVCPSGYKGITDKQKRIAEFYKDGFRLISEALAEIGYFIELRIPKRYRRRFDIMSGKLSES